MFLFSQLCVLGIRGLYRGASYWTHSWSFTATTQNPSFTVIAHKFGDIILSGLYLISFPFQSSLAVTFTFMLRTVLVTHSRHSQSSTVVARNHFHNRFNNHHSSTSYSHWSALTVIIRSHRICHNSQVLYESFLSSLRAIIQSPLLTHCHSQQ